MNKDKSSIVTISPEGSNYDQSLNPTNIIMAHELFGHARLHLKGDPAAKEETVPIKIENELREEQGLPSKEESRVFPAIEVKPKEEEKEQ